VRRRRRRFYGLCLRDSLSDVLNSLSYLTYSTVSPLIRTVEGRCAAAAAFTDYFSETASLVCFGRTQENSKPARVCGPRAVTSRSTGATSTSRVGRPSQGFRFMGTSPRLSWAPGRLRLADESSQGAEIWRWREGLKRALTPTRRALARRPIGRERREGL
jgi:hypothetical protein